MPVGFAKAAGMSADYIKTKRMEEEEMIFRGEVYYADLDPVVGSEQGGIRPVVILQNNMGNKYGVTVIAAPITSRKKNDLPTHVPVSDEYLKEGSLVMLEQIRTLDKRRLKSYVGRLSEVEMQKVEDALRISVLEDLGEKPMIVTLCAKCAEEFFDCKRFEIKKVNTKQEVKEKCTYCNTRYGYDFAIYNRK